MCIGVSPIASCIRVCVLAHVRESNTPPTQGCLCSALLSSLLSLFPPPPRPPPTALHRRTGRTCTSGSAPFSKSRRATGVAPYAAAMCSGVRPAVSFTLTCARACVRTRARCAMSQTHKTEQQNGRLVLGLQRYMHTCLCLHPLPPYTLSVTHPLSSRVPPLTLPQHRRRCCRW